jgi:hypothetical protein
VRRNGGAIGAARHQTIFKLTGRIEFVRQKPTDGKQHNNNTKGDQRPAPVTTLFVVCGHYYAKDCVERVALWSIFCVTEQAEFICI